MVQAEVAEAAEAQASAARVLCALTYAHELRHRTAAAALPALAGLLQGCTKAAGRVDALFAICNLTIEPDLCHRVADVALPQLSLALNVGRSGLLLCRCALAHR